jgi:hypothetical protein
MTGPHTSADRTASRGDTRLLRSQMAPGHRPAAAGGHTGLGACDP